ncbi:aldo/keto reductase [Terribacillus sp. DMT04]|uniref:aldo/keto reductase n=1 Tax=Terribacillus sp. DMT04 TaxID=2850441 RepID=UPI001C2C9873|nr:aldo/keto reductase [Terribacillus sp. DMT04]QXE03254.1 aldo/keto reductase [Terribacillus sp. DMT04]
MKTTIPTIKLHDGNTIPAMGFGTSGISGAQGAQSIISAIDAGYRLIDTAYMYENEGTVGKAIRNSSMPREKLQVTSKLPGRHHAYNKAITAIQESLYRANLDYYDLYLIHWPNPKQDLYVEAWQALQEAKRWGLVRSIGVCNFLPEHMEKLKLETGELPAVNQIELHPYFNQEEQRNWNKSHDVVTQSWSPLGFGGDLLQNESLNELAHTHHKSVSQIILRWHYQLGTASIPKSSKFYRQQENLAIFDFELNDEEMKTISSFTKEDGRIRSFLNPATFEEE